MTKFYSKRSFWLTIIPAIAVMIFTALSMCSDTAAMITPRSDAVKDKIRIGYCQDGDYYGSERGLPKMVCYLRINWIHFGREIVLLLYGVHCPTQKAAVLLLFPKPILISPRMIL